MYVFYNLSRNLSLRQRPSQKTITNHSAELWSSVPMDTSARKAPAPKSQGTLEKVGHRDCQSKSIRDLTMRLRLLLMSAYLLSYTIKSH